DLSSLRLAVTGAASVPLDLIRRMRSDLGFRTVLTAYGLTETCGVVTVSAASDEAELIATTAGRAMPGVEVECVNGAGNVVPPGEPGELRVRGYNVMQGYFDDPEATAEAITPDGWLMTGDIGVMNEAGYLRITDRIKDMFIVGGFNVYPAEIENLLCSLAGVAQCAVIGVPEERLGEVAKAFIVRQPGSTLDEAEVIAWSRRNMANYKVPRSVSFVDSLPLNAAGKVLKTALRASSGT
ncbi:MAG: AMP-binding protein, partial [Gammaproteobacteria bacterium]